MNPSMIWASNSCGDVDIVRSFRLVDGNGRYDAAAKAALVQELDLGNDAGGQRALAIARQDRPEEEMALAGPFGVTVTATDDEKW